MLAEASHGVIHGDAPTVKEDKGFKGIKRRPLAAAGKPATSLILGASPEATMPCSADAERLMRRLGGLGYLG